MVLEENVFLKELTLAKLRVDIIGIFFLWDPGMEIPGTQIPVILSKFKYFKIFLPANHTSAVDFVPALS